MDVGRLHEEAQGRLAGCEALPPVLEGGGLTLEQAQRLELGLPEDGDLLPWRDRAGNLLGLKGRHLTAGRHKYSGLPPDNGNLPWVAPDLFSATQAVLWVEGELNGMASWLALKDPRRGCDRPGERVRSAPPGPARSAEGARFLLSGGRRGGRQERRPFSRRSGLPERAPVPHRSPRTTPSSADWTPWEWGVAATAGPAEVGFSPRSGLAGGGEQKAARRGFDSPLLFALRLRPPETSPPPASPPFRCG